MDIEKKEENALPSVSTPEMAMSITLREYFAAQAMQALIARPGDQWPDAVNFHSMFWEESGFEGDEDELDGTETVAFAAWFYADSMLQARPKPTLNGGLPKVSDKPTVRDYFAGQAMLAFIARPGSGELSGWEANFDFRGMYGGNQDDLSNVERYSWRVLARAAYHYADRMLLARTAKTDP